VSILSCIHLSLTLLFFNQFVMAPTQLRILPAEILRVIASFSSIPSLLTLCLTSRVAYASATPHLYKSLVLAEPNAAYGAFRTLADRPLLAAYVRSLWVYTHSRLVQRPLPEGWWAALGEALARTTALTYILIQDPVALQPGVASVARFLGKLNAPTLREARLQIAWDAQHISAFVRRHPELMCLHVNGFVDSTTTSDVDNTSTTGDKDAKQIVGIESNGESAIGVRILSTPVSAARHLVPCAPSLTHVQILCEPYHATNATLSKKSWSLLHALSPLPSALRSLHISEMPEEGMDENLWSLLRLCSFSLVHLGVIPLPFANVRVTWMICTMEVIIDNCFSVKLSVKSCMLSLRSAPSKSISIRGTLHHPSTSYAQYAPSYMLFGLRSRASSLYSAAHALYGLSRTPKLDN
jgi:hypothetical protein